MSAGSEKLLHCKWHCIISSFSISHKFLVMQRILAETKNWLHYIGLCVVPDFAMSSFDCIFWFLCTWLHHSPGGSQGGGDWLEMLMTLSLATGEGLFFKAIADKEEEQALDMLRKEPKLVGELMNWCLFTGIWTHLRGRFFKHRDAAPPAEKTGRRSLRNRSSCPRRRPNRSRDWFELNWGGGYCVLDICHELVRNLT